MECFATPDGCGRSRLSSAVHLLFNFGLQSLEHHPILDLFLPSISLQVVPRFDSAASKDGLIRDSMWIDSLHGEGAVHGPTNF
jgi:hypothetical protein